MDREIVMFIITDLEADAKSMIMHLDKTNDPFETGYIKGYQDALRGHAKMLRDQLLREDLCEDVL